MEYYVMRYITKQQADEVIEYVNGYAMTYADYLDNMNIEFEVI